MVDKGGRFHILHFSVHFIHTGSSDSDDPGNANFIDEAKEETIKYWEERQRKYGASL